MQEFWPRAVAANSQLFGRNSRYYPPPAPADAKEPRNLSYPNGDDMAETAGAGLFCTLSRNMLTYPRKVFFEGRIAFPGKSFPCVGNG
jgi:hypothetical protein